MRAAALEGHATATDLADYLVRKGVPFRDAHDVVARAVREAERAGVDLAALPLETLKSLLAERSARTCSGCSRSEGSVAARHHLGGTAPARGTPRRRRAPRKRLKR